MRILAHRGAHRPESDDVRENTLAAFRLAIDVGADGVELDVRRTSDGVLVVLHDAVLPGGVALADTHAADLPDWLPTLEAALIACEGLPLVNVEIKNSPIEPGFDADHEIARQVGAALAGRGGILVSSFNLGTLDAFRRASRDIPTGWLTGPGWDQLAAVASAGGGGHAAINPGEAAVTAEVVDAAHGAGLEVVAWTVNDAARMVELAACGVDVLVTDRPVLACATLRGTKMLKLDEHPPIYRA